MITYRSTARRLSEGILAFSAICIWMYDFNLISAPDTSSTVEMPGIITSQQTQPRSFPWHTESLPRIPWSPLAIQEDEPLMISNPEQDQPGWTLQGLYAGSTKNGALIHDLDSGQTRLLLTGESWNGTTLQAVGKGWVRVSRDGSIWLLSMSSISDVEK